MSCVINFRSLCRLPLKAFCCTQSKSSSVQVRAISDFGILSAPEEKVPFLGIDVMDANAQNKADSFESALYSAVFRYVQILT